MQSIQNSKPKIQNSPHGFTLIELMVVIFILSLAAAVVLPRLPAPEGTRLKNSARNLATGIRFLNDQAIVTKGVYRLRFNMTENTIAVTKVPTGGGEEIAPDDQFLNRKFLEEGITVEDVTVPRLGTVSDGEVSVTFGPGGSQDLLTVHLKGGDNRFTVIAYPAGGKVRVLEGRQEVET